MKVNVVLYPDTAGGHIPPYRFEQVMTGMRVAEAVVQNDSLYETFNYTIYEPGFALNPTSPEPYNTITDERVKIPDTKRGDISIGITTRRLFSRMLNPLRTRDKVIKMHDETSVLTSYKRGAMILTTYDMSTSQTQSSSDFVTHTAHGGYHLLSGGNHCDQNCCLANETFEKIIPPQPAFGPLGELSTPSPTVEARIFCADTRLEMTKNYIYFLDEIEFRKRMRHREDLP